MLPVFCLVAGITFLLYLPSLWSDFVYDAEAQILIGDYIHNPSNFIEVVTFQVMGKDVLDFNRPVQLFSLMLDSLVWGKWAVGYHLTSNILHACNAGLLALLILRFLPKTTDGANRLVAGLCALVFAFHPVLVEAVAEISYREDVLATGFVLLALLAGEFFACSRGVKTFILGNGVVVAVWLACASKETGVVTPLLLLALAFIFHREQVWRRWGVLILAVCVVTVCFLFVRFVLESETSIIFTNPPRYLGGSLGMVFEIQPRLWVFLIKIIFWPFGLSADYTPQNVIWITLSWAIFWLFVVLVAQILLARKSRLAAFGSVIFWLGLVPVSNFLPMYRPLADRFLYLPMLGVAFMLAGVLTLWDSRSVGRKVASCVVIVALIFLGGLSIQRQSVFSSSLALWQDTVTKSPTSYTANFNLSYALRKAGDSMAALSSLRAAQKTLKSENADILAAQAFIYEDLGKQQKAEEALRRAVSLDHRYERPDELVEALVMTQEDAATMEKILLRLKK
ncbi:MAG: hypothetical protein ACK5LK_08500 [Chthoniobacterales bacterium]